MANYLDKTGLEYFWGKIKTAIRNKPIGLVVTATKSTEIIYTTDYTYAEIGTALNNGVNVVIKKSTGEIYPYVGKIYYNSLDNYAFGYGLVMNGVAALDGFLVSSSATVWVSQRTTIPTATSQLDNDSGFLTSYTETDPTVPAWAKAASKPTYTASEVGALPSSTVIPSKTSDLTNDSGYLTLSTLPIYDGSVVTSVE